MEGRAKNSLNVSVPQFNYPDGWFWVCQEDVNVHKDKGKPTASYIGTVQGVLKVQEWYICFGVQKGIFIIKTFEF